MNVCMVPGCIFDAVHPPSKGHVCLPCRRRLKSKTYFSPVLYWGMLWVMTQRVHRRNLEKSLEANRVIADYRELLTVKELLRILLDHPTGLAQFLVWAHMQGIALPSTEMKWLDHFTTEIEEKGQCRILCTYWTMLCPDVTDRRAWILLQKEGHGYLATGNTALSNVERVVRNLTVQRKGDQETWVLQTPWHILFPPVLQLTEKKEAPKDLWG